MSTLINNVFRAPVNTRIPAMSHWLSWRIQLGNAVFTTNGTYQYALSLNPMLPGQNAISSTLGSFAPTSNPAQDSEPQLNGSVFFVQHVNIRKPDGSFVSGGAGAAGNLTVVVYNNNIASVDNNTGLVTRAANSRYTGINVYTEWLWTSATTGNQLWSQEAVWSSSVAGQVQFVSAASTGTIGSANKTALSISATTALGLQLSAFQPGLGDQFGLTIFTSGYTAGASPATATAFTLDILGYWQQTV